MAMIASDNLSLLVGDGAGVEVFSILKGASVARFEITQKSNITQVVSADGWVVEGGASGRRAMVECLAYATDEAPAIRLRTLALSGAVANFKLEASPTETWVFSAMVTHYREFIDAGDIKKIQCRLESSGAVTLL